MFQNLVENEFHNILEHTIFDNYADRLHPSSLPLHPILNVKLKFM